MFYGILKIKNAFYKSVYKMIFMKNYTFDVVKDYVKYS